MEKAKRFEEGTGDAVVESLGATGLISLGASLVVTGNGDPMPTLGGLTLVVAGVALYTIRRHYRDAP